MTPFRVGTIIQTTLMTTLREYQIGSFGPSGSYANDPSAALRSRCLVTNTANFVFVTNTLIARPREAANNAGILPPQPPFKPRASMQELQQIPPTIFLIEPSCNAKIAFAIALEAVRASYSIMPRRLQNRRSAVVQPLVLLSAPPHLF